MLHEIFKGMDNAAEQINENFQSGSIVEHNLDEGNPLNGYYVKFGSGFQVCFISDLELVYETTVRLATTWEFPAQFTGAPVVLPVQENSFASDALRTGSFGVGAIENLANIRYFSAPSLAFGANDRRSFSAVAIGRWK